MPILSSDDSANYKIMLLREHAIAQHELWSATLDDKKIQRHRFERYWWQHDFMIAWL